MRDESLWPRNGFPMFVSGEYAALFGLPRAPLGYVWRKVTTHYLYRLVPA